jgi:ACS family hexuronate transporter-like MFS transporter
MIPAGLKACSEWFPARERSVEIGYFNLVTSAGAMLAPPLVIWAIMFHGWGFSFIITGIISLIWSIAWLVIYKRPEEHTFLSEEERKYILDGQESKHQASNNNKMTT